jgi:hypothetical protein
VDAIKIGATGTVSFVNNINLVSPISTIPITSTQLGYNLKQFNTVSITSMTSQENYILVSNITMPVGVYLIQMYVKTNVTASTSVMLLSGGFVTGTTTMTGGTGGLILASSGTVPNDSACICTGSATVPFTVTDPNQLYNFMICINFETASGVISLDSNSSFIYYVKIA